MRRREEKRREEKRREEKDILPQIALASVRYSAEIRHPSKARPIDLSRARDVARTHARTTRDVHGAGAGCWGWPPGRGNLRFCTPNLRRFGPSRHHG